jgi:hypothetical protein
MESFTTNILKRVKVEPEGFEKERDVTEPMNETDTFICLGLIQSKQIQHAKIKRQIKLQWLVCKCVCVCVCVRAHWFMLRLTHRYWCGRQARTHAHTHTHTQVYDNYTTSANSCILDFHGARQLQECCHVLMARRSESVCL